MPGVRRHSKLAPLNRGDLPRAHDLRHTILRTTDSLDVVQLIPDPRTAVIAVVVQKDTSYLNEQCFIRHPTATLWSPLKHVITAPRYF